MPELDDTVAAATAAAANDATAGDAHASAGRAGPSRRSMLQVAAGAGAAGVAATTLGGMVGKMAARSSTRPVAEPATPDGAEPLVLHVRDASSGEIDVFRGTTQTRLQDRDLAAHILRASQRRSSAIARPHVPERTF
ncbi:MAG TPA: hypothetical protein VF506_04425 [Streptosporangiaceae bacterium]